MITSMDPLRIYVFEGDVLLRFCPEKYHPFDAANRDKYVVHDDYRPTWKVRQTTQWNGCVKSSNFHATFVLVILRSIRA